MTATRLLDISLAILWAVVFAALTVVLSWQFQARWIDQVNDFFKQRSLIAPVERYEKIFLQYNEDNNHQQAVAALSALLTDLQAVQKGDELSETRRVTFAQLVLVLRRLGQFDQALAITDQWLAFDSRDVNARLSKALLQMLNPDSRQDGELAIALLQQHFPQSLVIANGAATAYASIGEPGKAFVFFEPFLTGKPGYPQIGSKVVRAWVIDARPNNKHWQLDDRGASLSYQPGETLNLLNIAFPMGSDLQITFTAQYGDKAVPFTFSGLTPLGDNQYRKRMGADASIELEKIQPTLPLTLRIEAIQAKPETLEKLLSAAAQPFVLQQLSAMPPQLTNLYRRLINDPA